MENLTNKIIELRNGKKYLVIRQATYLGDTYYYVGLLTENEEDVTDDFTFLKRKEDNGVAFVEEVTDKSLLEVLAKNITINE